MLGCTDLGNLVLCQVSQANLPYWEVGLGTSLDSFRTLKFSLLKQISLYI